jgi:hypothetical protein
MKLARITPVLDCPGPLFRGVGLLSSNNHRPTFRQRHCAHRSSRILEKTPAIQFQLACHCDFSFQN